MNEDGMTESDRISALRREAERLEEDATYSSKGHFNAEATWVRRHYWLGIPATVLTAIAGATLVKPMPELASALVLLASLLTGLMTFLKPNERAGLHRAAAGQFLGLRNEARFFREVELLQTDRFVACRWAGECERARGEMLGDARQMGICGKWVNALTGIGHLQALLSHPAVPRIFAIGWSGGRLPDCQNDNWQLDDFQIDNWTLAK